jgi:hypothetical protein
MHVTIPTEGQPAIIRLDSAEHLACRSCGVQVAPPHGSGNVEHFDSHSRMTIAGVQDIRGGHRVDLTYCPDCLAIRERASALLDEFPRVRAQIGGRSVALHRVESALTGLDALGRIGSFTFHTPRGLQQLIEHMAAPGAGVRWLNRYVPIVELDASDDSCASSRWAHLNDDQRQVLREGAAALMRARTEQPRLYGPPADTPHRGCLLCGIGAIQALPSQSGAIWTAEFFNPSSVGGPNGTTIVRGYTCPACSRAIEGAGSIGATAMERSLVRHLGVVQRGPVVPELVGLRAWVVAAARPNTIAWGHLGDLDAIRRLFAQ